MKEYESIVTRAVEHRCKTIWSDIYYNDILLFLL